MQCKARGLSCSFYKDGSLEVDSNEERHSSFMSQEPSTSKKQPNQLSESAIFFSESTDENHTKLKRKGPMLESRVSNMLACLGDVLKKTPSMSEKNLLDKLWPPAGSFGNFITWTVEPPLPTRYSGSIEMPSAKIQRALLDVFFKTKHQVLLCIIPSYFYEQLEVKGLFITPLILNAIYALSARFVNLPDCPKPDIFYHRARRLLDDFMDVPRTSTVVSAYLLSLYEPSADVYRPGSYHCRHWEFSGLAFRMCIELGLYDENNIDPALTDVEKEQRRRIFWACYDLDKFYSGGWERPWMIQSSFTRTRLPAPLPEESIEEQLNLRILIYKIKFTHMIEKDLELKNQNRSCLSGFSEENISQEDICLVFTTHFNRYIEFFYSLPTEMMWTPTVNVSISDILQLPKPLPTIAHFHLYFHVVLVELLTKIPANDSNRHQLRVAAATITQLSYYLCQEPSHIIKLDFIAHTLIHAIKIHMLYLEGPDDVSVRQGWLLFYRSIYCLQQLSKYVNIPNCQKFLQQVYHVYGIDMSEPFLNPNGPFERETDTNAFENQPEVFQDLTVGYLGPIFQYHQPPAYMQSSLWPPSKPSINTDVIVPSQLNKSPDNILRRQVIDAQTQQSKTSIYPSQDDYDKTMNSYL
ncbi:fungal-specific transcription factor domain-containing protein [Sporodiniella umbellata]|nr:fungal-specific transcription factor domain-containing protein [Sporodiniella umbellata]